MRAIYLLPLAGVERALVQELMPSLENVFQAEIALMNVSVDMETFFDKQRHQYNSTDILQYVKENFTPSHLLSRQHLHAKKYLVITSEDLFIPILTYVFGEAELSGSVAVVSYYRLLNERYGLPPNRTLLSQRLQKEAVHELGHAYGLVHCHTPECVMHTSTYAGDIDLKSEMFCDDCLREVRRTDTRP